MGLSQSINENHLKSFVIVGCGPHFRARYFEVLENLNQNSTLSIQLVVDLKSQEAKIRNFFRGKTLKPKNFLFIDDSLRNVEDLSVIESLICTKVNLSNIDGMIICTEPKVHKGYALLGIKYGLDIFVDKPLTAFVEGANRSFYGDYLEILEQSERKQTNFVISCERRLNPAYQFIRDYTAKFVERYHVPVSFIGINLGDGNWVTDNEYKNKENHPFKYGYGILLHSGYHYVDLLSTFLAINDRFFADSKEELEIKTFSNGFIDVSQGTTQNTTQKLCALGETDLMLIGRLKKNNKSITNFSLNLIGTSVSKRREFIEPMDPYLSSGRVRQEDFIVHLGHLCSIHLISIPFTKLANTQNNLKDFSISILNSPVVLDEPSIIYKQTEDFKTKDIKNSLNISARQKQLLSFINGGDGNSSLKSHKKSIYLLDTIYQKLKEENNNT